jgi:3-hydroxybutyryl-CoA dehydrogenase
MNSIKTICVCGAGTMGSGIAQVAAMAGYSTIQFDINMQTLDKSRLAIEKSLQFLVDKGKLEKQQKEIILGRIHFTYNLIECKADLIIEAIIEKKEAKMELFHTLFEVNGSNTIYASNTSSISINEIANACSFANKIVGMHFFNPATIMKLVEVVKTTHNSNEDINTIVEVCKKLNKSTCCFAEMHLVL